MNAPQGQYGQPGQHIQHTGMGPESPSYQQPGQPAQFANMQRVPSGSGGPLLSPPLMGQQQHQMRSPPSPAFQQQPQPGQHHVPISQQLSQQYAHVGHGQPGQPQGQPYQGPPSSIQSRQPSYSAGMTGLEGQINQMNMAPSPQPGYASPQQDYAGPAKGKRSARAYHQYDTPQAPSPQQQPQYGYQQQGQQQAYANAPPPGPQPGQYHQQQQQQQYLHQEQPQGQVFQQPGIPQPPHNPGTKLPGLRNRIDPDQIPSVVDVQEQDQQVYDAEAYLTCGRGTVPLSTTQFTAIDQGSSTPRFIRLTTYNLPATDDLASLSHLPMGIVLQPFAEPLTENGEEPVYTVDFSQTAPPRCKRCRGYINPWCMFIEAGQKFVCNLCGSATEVPPEYFAHLDVNGRRLDLDQRPELLKGSIDFVVPKDYWVQDPPPASSTSNLTIPRQPQPLHYIFAIDVSCDVAQRRSVQGQNPQEPELRIHPMLREVCRNLKKVIYGTEEDSVAGEDSQEQTNGQNPPARKGGLPAGARVAIVTFDKVVHFYNLKAGLDKAQMLVVGDIDDMFVPLSEGFCVDAQASRTLVEGLLDSIPDLFATNTVVEAAIGGPLRASLLALKTIGGQVNIFSTRLPTTGPGALKHRDETKVQGTDKERQLFVPQDPFYRSIAEEAVEAGIGINLFLFPSQFIDVASLGVLAGLTGGDVFFHPRFDPVRDGIKLQSQIRRVLTRETGYGVTMRVRCSEGLRIAEHFGNFFQRNVTDLEFGTLDADKAVAALVKHDGKLDDKRDAYFQCAVLYTGAAGERRVRLHNIAVPVTQVMANVFRYADMDTTITYCAKEAIAKTITKPLREVRDQLTDLCTKVLLAYRKHCASTTSPGQLILPESFKLFPVYALALIKSKALKGGPVVSDVRTHYMRLFKGMGVADTMDLLYPRMIRVHTLPPEAMMPDEHGRVRLPRLMRCSYARMEPHGAYFIHNGDIAVLWLGNAVSPQILRDLYDVESTEELNTRMTRLPKLETRLSEQLRGIVSTYEKRRSGRRLPLYIARQNIDGIEIEFSNMLIEDANNDNLSYVDYLCFVHKNIQQELSGEKQASDVDAQSMWRQW